MCSFHCTFETGQPPWGTPMREPKTCEKGSIFAVVCITSVLCLRV